MILILTQSALFAEFVEFAVAICTSWNSVHTSVILDYIEFGFKYLTLWPNKYLSYWRHWVVHTIEYQMRSSKPIHSHISIAIFYSAGPFPIGAGAFTYVGCVS